MFDTLSGRYDGRNILLRKDGPPEGVTLRMNLFYGLLYCWYQRMKRRIGNSVCPDHVSTCIVYIEPDAHTGLPGWVVVTHNTSYLE
jgi:hypothetical protein